MFKFNKYSKRFQLLLKTVIMKYKIFNLIMNRSYFNMVTLRLQFNILKSKSLSSWVDEYRVKAPMIDHCTQAPITMLSHNVSIGRAQSVTPVRQVHLLRVIQICYEFTMVLWMTTNSIVTDLAYGQHDRGGLTYISNT